MNFSRVLVALAMLAGASAFVVPTVLRTSVAVKYGKYDEQLWDIAAKQDVFAAWDPQSPRSDVNFNPFERNADGNAADCSGFFPGEAKYKDPMRPDASFEIMMAENAAMAEINADPKTSITGAPGCLKL
uniref:Uncharacterized protein n=1 Tax=Octactis speculum TaxID=3111310 RepID=A0A7S2CF61_9STRA|mmetsp:Transcript_34658/g.46810  ORF Transcript_34658/g.46810 Transcript_34658/m.46810 type:complete len:129 (+) Transcript_34658:58-444(+)